MLKIITSTNDSLHGHVLRKKYLNKGDLIIIKKLDGRKKRFRIEHIQKTKDGYVIKDSHNTLVLRDE